MGIEKLIDFAVSIVLVASLTGQLPRFTRMIQQAQAQLLWESRASAWGNPNAFWTKREGINKKSGRR